MHHIWKRVDLTVWSRNLTLFACAVFLDRFGQGILGGARMNFFVDTLGLSNSQVLWLEGIREVPGLVLIFIAALTMLLPLAWQGAVALLLMGAGFTLYAVVGSYSALLVVVMVDSLGFHLWTPLNSAIGMSLSAKKNTGQVLGMLASVGSLASIVGMIAISVISRFFETMPLTNYYVIGGVSIMLAALLVARLPKNLGATKEKPARILLKRRYWLYYVLIFFSGARKLVLGSFITLVLVQDYDLKVWQVSTLMLVSSVLTLLISPVLGGLIDRLGERVTTPASYAILALCCVGYAVIPNLWVLLVLWTLIKLAAPLGMGLSTYVYRTAPPEELAPTLTAGVTFDHISSVSVPFLAGALLPIIDYSGVFLATAALILLSIPFARALQVQAPAVLQPAPVAVES
ncbi:MAG TPA: MFS transporter [Anaerolineae bacterium]|nr:MFS transporter [Anaerolineae bacterium]HQI84894.1 MFS transporter [Anaerolineae bacterium]